ncbi:unnamed protein product, partial [Didymodactylos carnosus]
VLIIRNIIQSIMTSLTTATAEIVTQILFYNTYNKNSSNYSASIIGDPNFKCIQRRLYSTFYVLIKQLNPIYLRFLIVPSILLNILCLIVLSRPHLSKKSTTICYLRALAVFDMLCISLKFFRIELNYQSAEKGHNIFLLTSPFCKVLYVLLSASISIDMWIIALMSLDKLIAVRYPLKSTILLTQKRAFISCVIVTFVMLCLNLYFIKTADIKLSNKRKYCTLITESILIDMITASFLPIGIITCTNTYIAIVLHNSTKKTLTWNETTRLTVASIDAGSIKYNNLKKYRTFFKKRKSSIDLEKNTTLNQQQRHSSSVARTSSQYDSGEHRNSTNVLKRTSTQVTRMLLAVTSSLIILNIPNTLFFLLIKIYDPRLVLHDPHTKHRHRELLLRNCDLITDRDLNIYKFGIYSSLLQNILGDLPHVVNFFIYCIAGKKFRLIFKTEVLLFFQKTHILHKKDTGKWRISTPGLGNVSQQIGAKHAPSISTIARDSYYYNQIGHSRRSVPYAETKLLNNMDENNEQEQRQQTAIIRTTVDKKRRYLSAENFLTYSKNMRNKRSISINGKISFLSTPDLSRNGNNDSCINTLNNNKDL